MKEVVFDAIVWWVTVGIAVSVQISVAVFRCYKGNNIETLWFLVAFIGVFCTIALAIAGYMYGILI